MSPVVAVVLLLAAAAALPYSATSMIGVASTIFVSKSGHAHYKTVQEAVNSVPSGNSRWIRIHVAAGVYESVSLYLSLFRYHHHRHHHDHHLFA